MKQAKEALTKEAMAAVASKAWSTFPRGRCLRTLPLSSSSGEAGSPAECREPQTKEKNRHADRTPKQPPPSLPDHVAISMSVVLGRTRASQEERDEHVLALASYFASSVSNEAKLNRLRAIIALVTPKEAWWQLLPPIMRDTLRFLTDRNFDWPHRQHTAHVLLFELRAMCLYEMERQSEIIKAGQVAAGCFLGAARFVEHGLASTVPLIHCGIDLAGNHVKQRLTPVPSRTPTAFASVPRPLHSKRQIVILTYTNVAKRATERARETAKWTAISIRDASTKGIQNLAQRMEQEQLGQRLVPHEGHRNVLIAVGTIGMASVGAAAIVAEAMVATTASIFGKTSAVAADVVRYKYGDGAGRVVEDASDTTGNVFQTVAHVTMLETTVLARAVAKHTIIVQAKKTMGEEEAPTKHRSNDSLTALKEGNFESHLLTLESPALIASDNEWIEHNTCSGDKSHADDDHSCMECANEKGTGSEHIGQNSGSDAKSPSSEHDECHTECKSEKDSAWIEEKSSSDCMSHSLENEEFPTEIANKQNQAWIEQTSGSDGVSHSTEHDKGSADCASEEDSSCTLQYVEF